MTNQTGLGAFSVLFSVDRYNQEVDEIGMKRIRGFFDQFHWNTTEDFTVSKIKMRDLFKVVNPFKRWIYLGSLTTPPCEHRVLWNVLSTVYPIPQEYVSQYIKK